MDCRELRESEQINLIFDAKERKTFRSAAWNTESNPDLCFASVDSQNRQIPVSRKVLDDFPHSQHRPIILEVGTQIPIIRSTPRPRWNFGKAQWDKFAAQLDSTVRWIPPKSSSYDRFIKAVITTAKRCIPRGFRREYVPGWNDDIERLYQEFKNSGDSEIADELLHSLDAERCKKWEQAASNMNFKKSIFISGGEYQKAFKNCGAAKQQQKLLNDLRENTPDTTSADEAVFPTRPESQPILENFPKGIHMLSLT
ncbi:unnamed protein product [Callosobruchus maculatus]|uniref:Endonuclease/exonuclease/phosphatase domain-containing protein n=1 Tax=Callosobruchus maculatus TaxID=64391 RepID=A0A653DI07_CALMS|nr:unnamed protein product [Callosobruchus maculatus]